jgi:hypothetical protein
VLLPAGVRATQSTGDPFPRLQEKGAIAALIDCWGVARPGAGCSTAKADMVRALSADHVIGSV